MVKTIDKLKKLKKSKVMREAEKVDYDKKGRAVINIGIESSDEFFHPYSYKTYDLVNPELIDYIEEVEAQIPPKEELSIDVYTEEATSNFEKKCIRESAKRHYAEKIVSLKQKSKKDLIIAMVLISLGVACAILEVWLWDIWQSQFVDIIVTIIAWTFIWDGFEMLIIDLPENRRMRFKCYRLMNAKVHIRQYSKKIQKDYGIGEFEDEKD